MSGSLHKRDPKQDASFPGTKASLTEFRDRTSNKFSVGSRLSPSRAGNISLKSNCQIPGLIVTPTVQNIGPS